MANEPQEILARLTVKEVLDRYPGALRTFTELQLLCVGCPTEAFHTLADVAREHELDINNLISRIEADIGKPPH
jgi:hybrid cluster-associated redox disulfide protein